MPQAPKWLIQWLGVGVIIAGGVAVVFVAQRGASPAVPAIPGNSGSTETATSSAALLAAEIRYRDEVRAAIAGWNDGERPPEYGAMQQRLMDITVPSRFRQPHLDLVIAATALKEAQRSGDADARRSAAQEFTRALERFSFTAPDGND